jgi:ABC-type branched-subunit amino acid transport system ATPase component/ABC-type branched-subunit amino acid transport system permease subunit
MLSPMRRRSGNGTADGSRSGRGPAPTRWRSHDLVRLGHLPLPQAIAGVVVLYGIGAAFGLSSSTTFLLTATVTFGIAALGLDITVGYTGQLSLAQGAMFGLGAYTAAILTAEHSVPILGALAASLCVGLVVGIVLGIPASRLGTIGFGIVTLGYTLIFSDLLNALPYGLTGGENGIPDVAAPLLARQGNPLGGSSLFVLILACAGLAYVAHAHLRRSGFGRKAVASKDEAIGAAGLGIPIGRIRVAGFALAGAFGALAGALYAYSISVVSPQPFSLQQSILFLLMVILGGAGSQWGPVAGIAIIGIFPIWLSVSHGSIEPYIYGGLLLAVVRFLPRGIDRNTAAPVRTEPRRRRVFAKLRWFERHDNAEAGNHASCLEVEELSRSFEGIVALDHVSLKLGCGEILAVIGPNGSGKTTLLNVINGFYPPSSGTIVVTGAAIARPSPRRMAQAGVARTFQTPRVFPSLSVTEYLALATSYSRVPDGTIDHELLDILGQMGLLDHQDRPARGLAHGQMRMLEVAGAIQRHPRVLLLDEPAAGLSHEEMSLIERLIRRLAATGVGVVIVEHHLEWITDLADRVAVMADGRILWEGKPSDLYNDQRVRDAYLGSVAGG